MKTFFTILFLFFITSLNFAHAQQFVDKRKFFSDTSVVNATLSLNMRKVLAKKRKEGYIFPATFSCKLNDTLNVNDNICVEVRGHFRRSYCYLPPLKLIFKRNESAAFYHLKDLKLVSSCMISYGDDQNLLKEYLIYNIYNLFTDKSFRARLLNLNYRDSISGKNMATQHAFLIEDIKEVAKRNESIDWTDHKLHTERTDRRQMTIVSLFEYMIGNTDWSVPNCHNIKLLRSKTDSLSSPYVIPYDFDFSGLVNTNYSFPNEKMGIDNVQTRLYRGFPRSIEEVNEVLAIFNAKKGSIYATINNFKLLGNDAKKEMIAYIDQFYETINDADQVKNIFVTNARTN